MILGWAMSRLFWAQMALAAQVAISGPKKVFNSGPPLIMALVMDVAHIKITMYRVIKTTGALTVIKHLPTIL
jgi:hypothetical protein